MSPDNKLGPLDLLQDWGIIISISDMTFILCCNWTQTECWGDDVSVGFVIHRHFLIMFFDSVLLLKAESVQLL